MPTRAFTRKSVISGTGYNDNVTGVGASSALNGTADRDPLAQWVTVGFVQRLEGRSCR
ncbi:hypothetical protein EDD90_9114 [Streptomyces sp. Ag109_O5-1]|nr:hypothetical protein EDD90_9114 [Streptomyces sp. Ag109_O5-1]